MFTAILLLVDYRQAGGRLSECPVAGCSINSSVQSGLFLWGSRARTATQWLSCFCGHDDTCWHSWSVLLDGFQTSSRFDSYGVWVLCDLGPDAVVAGSHPKYYRGFQCGKSTGIVLVYRQSSCGPVEHIRVL